MSSHNHPAASFASAGEVPPETVPRLTIAVDAVALITTECITVTSAMRKHARWAQSSVSAILGGVSSSAKDRNPSLLPMQTGGDSSNYKSGLHASRMRRDTLGEDDGLVGHWGRRGKKGKSVQDNPLMSAFARLRSDLRGCTDIRAFDTPSLLHPFLQVIRSSSTSASITSLAIVAITKFFDYKLIASSSPRLPLAMQLLSAAITHCRFEASDSAADEIVLLQILRLMESMISGPGGDLLSDESVCEMMETGLSMCCQKRLSDLVRRSAEMSMIKMCQVIFERLNAIEHDHPEQRDVLVPFPDDTSNLIVVDTAVNGVPIGGLELSKGPTIADSERLQDPIPDSLNQTDTDGRSDPPPGSNGSNRIQPNGNAHVGDGKIESYPDKSASNHSGERTHSVAVTTAKGISDEPTDQVDHAGIKPYGLPSIRELFRVLVDLLRPQNREHTDALRVMALRILDVALEVAGPSIAKHPSLANLAKDDLCRYLFQLIRTDNTPLLNESLRVAGTLLATCREVLKLQQELFLSYLVECLHPQVEIPQEVGIDSKLYEGVPKTPKLVRPAASQANSGRSTPVPIKERHQLGMDGTYRKPDAREAMIESIGALTRIPGFLVELYINYDCEVDRNDLCEDLVGLLSRNAFPDSATWSTTSVPPLALDSLLTYVQFIAERLNDTPKSEGYPNISRLREQRSRKKVIINGATRFNVDPRDGIAYLATHGIIDNPNNPQSIARFLKSTTRIAKKKLGEYISKRDQEPLLKAFLDLFDFGGKRVDEALRDLLNSFRLPGESQLIERIVTVFSQKYCSNTTIEGIANEDAVFTLTYSIIMLNTDQHNPNLKKEKRMTIKDFAKNLRGVNGGGDFEPEYLEEIYKSIKTNEIILPDEHNDSKAFHYTWEGLLVKAQEAGSMVLCDTNVFDADMFQATWKPIIATLSYVFMSASDDAVYSRVVLGFDQCASIAARYGITEAIDRIVYCLSSMSSLSSRTPTSTTLNTEVQAEKQSVMVSELAVKFGRDYRAQLACAVLFRLIHGKEHSILDGWQQIVQIWLNLFANSLLSPDFSGSQDLLGMEPIPLQPPNHVIDREQRNESGLLSSFTSYLSSYAADDPPEPSEEEVESTLCTVDCLASCPMESIFRNTLSMPLAARQSLVHALTRHLPEPSSPVVLAARPDQPRPTPVRANGTQKHVPKLAYDPTVSFVLELSTLLTGRDKESIISLGETVADSLQSMIRNASKVQPILLARAIRYLFYLMDASQRLQDQTILKTPVILHTISGFEQSTLEQVSDSTLKSLELCMRHRTALRSEIVNTPDFWLILSNLHSIKAGAAAVFEILEDVTSSEPVAVTADNYVAAISLLDSYATSGSVGAGTEQQLPRRLPAQTTERKAQRSAEAHASPPNSDEKEIVLRGHRAVVLMSHIVYQVPGLIKNSQLEPREAWMTYWTQIFQKLQGQCQNPCRRIRRQACSALQSALLSQDLQPSADEQWALIFRTVLFGLISRLLKPEIYQTDPMGMNETRLQTANLLCRTFLHYLPTLSQKKELLDLWLNILDVMDRLMNSGQGDTLEEAVPESLKNILLVMANSKVLDVPVPGQQPSFLWSETRKRVDRFLPGLIDDLFLPREEEGQHNKSEERERSDVHEDGESTKKQEQERSAAAERRDSQASEQSGSDQGDVD